MKHENKNHIDQDSNKTVLSRENINEILTTELQKLEGFSESELSIQYTLVEHDELGCNWSASINPKIVENIVSNELLNVIHNARTKYNVKL